MLKVDFVLKDDKGCLNDCFIYDNNDRGILPINDYNHLDWLLSNKSKIIYFQNDYINGYCYCSNICEFTIKQKGE